MRRNKRPLIIIILGIVSLVGFLYTVFAFQPTQTLTIYNWQFEIIPVFFALLLLCLFFLISYALKSKTQGILISLLITSFLMLKMLDLAQPLFVALIIVLFITLEFLFRKQY